MWKARKKQYPEADRRVLCGVETEYSKETPVEDHKGHVAGAGQPCHDCRKNLFPKGQDCHG